MRFYAYLTSGARGKHRVISKNTNIKLVVRNFIKKNEVAFEKREFIRRGGGRSDFPQRVNFV